jgi:hypothetical protein
MEIYVDKGRELGEREIRGMMKKLEMKGEVKRGDRFHRIGDERKKKKVMKRKDPRFQREAR